MLKEKMDFHGPLSLDDDYNNEEGDISCHGPFSANGSINARSVSIHGPSRVRGSLNSEIIRIHGPLSCDGDLIGKEVNIHGPLSVDKSTEVEELDVHGPWSNEGHAKISTGEIHGPLKIRDNLIVEKSLSIQGPLKSTGEIEAGGSLAILGPLTAKNVKGETIEINGPIKIDNSLVALKEIIIEVSSRRYDTDPFRVNLIKAPKVILRTDGWKKDLVKTSVQIEADELILDGIIHTGSIKAKDIILENNAQHEPEN